MHQSNLPQEWEITKLGNYIFLKNGYAFKTKGYCEKNNNSTPVIRISDIDGIWASDENAVYTKEIPTGFNVRKGDLLIAMSGATTGKIGIYNGNEPAYQNQRVGNLKLVNEELGDNCFRNHLITYLQDDILKLAHGGAQPNIAGKTIENIEIALPPLAEQTHLANLLDDLTTRVQKIQESLNRIPELLKTFRQSVLARAVSGELTAEWRGTFDYKEKDGFIFSSDWTVSNLGKEFNYGKCQKKNPDEIFSDEWVLELEDIEKDTSKLLVKVYNSERKVKSTKNIFEKGDVLYGKLRPYLNKIILADDNGVCTTEIIPIKTNDKILKNYLFYWLKSPYFSNFVNQLTYGINMPRLGTADGKKILFVYPNLEEQQQIVHQVEHYFALADEIEHQTKLAQEKVNYLTQSILAKAFRGELTANWRAANQAVISGENSAKALLAKIENELKKGKK